MSNITYLESTSVDVDEVVEAYKATDPHTRAVVRKLLDVQNGSLSSAGTDVDIIPNIAGSVNLAKICKDYGIRVYDYQSIRKTNAWINNPHQKEIDAIMRESDGIALSVGDATPIIVLKPNLEALEIRYVVAHELGHILLGHLRFRRDFKNKMPRLAELEADIFAAVLVAKDILWTYTGAEA